MNILLAAAVLLAVNIRQAGESSPTTAGTIPLAIALTWACVIVDVWSIPVPRPWFAAGLVACALTSAIHPLLGVPVVVGCLYIALVHIIAEALRS